MANTFPKIIARGVHIDKPDDGPPDEEDADGEPKRNAVRCSGVLVIKMSLLNRMTLFQSLITGVRKMHNWHFSRDALIIPSSRCRCFDAVVFERTFSQRSV